MDKTDSVSEKKFCKSEYFFIHYRCAIIHALAEEAMNVKLNSDTFLDVSSNILSTKLSCFR